MNIVPSRQASAGSPAFRDRYESVVGRSQPCSGATCGRNTANAPFFSSVMPSRPSTMSRHEATGLGGVRAETSTRRPFSSRSVTGEKRGSWSAESTARAATASTSGRIGRISPMQPRRAPVAASFSVTNAPIFARVAAGASASRSRGSLRPVTAHSIDSRARRRRNWREAASSTALVSPAHSARPAAAM